MTLFHGLPSDRVRAIAQGGDGALWFGTDAGLVRYDGRRVQRIGGEEVAARRVLALRFDEDGETLWAGTDAGAYVVSAAGGELRSVAGTAGKRVTSIATAKGERGRAAVATSEGVLFDCRVREDLAAAATVIADHTTPGASAKGGQPLELTSIVMTGESYLVGTRGRGLLAVEGGAAREVGGGRPRAFFVESLIRDDRGRVWLGAQTTSGDSGLFRSEGIDESERVRGDEGAAGGSEGRGREGAQLRPFVKVTGSRTGTVTALALDGDGDLWAGTDGAGVFRYRDGQRLEQLTFAGTAGGLRSNSVSAVFVDREGVVWIGTDRGVCRYDSRALKIEQVSADAQSNFVRTLFRTHDGRLLAGSNKGVFARDDTSGRWRAVGALANKRVYAVAEDAEGALLIGTAGGLFVGLDAPPAEATEVRADVEGVEESGGATDENGNDAGEAGASEGELEEIEPEARPAATRPPAVGGDVRAVAVFRGQTFIAVYGRGVERVERRGSEWRRTLVSPKDGRDAGGRQVVSLYAAPDKLWIGTAGGGAFFFDGTTVRSEPTLEKLKGAAVWAMSGAGAGGDVLWLATGRGLYVYRAGDQSLIEAAPDVDARGVVVAGGDKAGNPQAWCATAGAGLLKVSMDERFGAMVARLDGERGLPSQNAFAVLASSEENGFGEALLIATSRGVGRYEPGLTLPALSVTRVTGAGEYAPGEMTRGIRLAYPQNSFVVDVAATGTRTFPEQFQYGFLLTDDAGVVVRRKLARDASFQLENLPPGKYRVEAMGFTADLLASPPLTFGVEVERAPFPWATAALSLLLVAALVAIVWGAAQNRRLVRTAGALAEVNRQLGAARLQLAHETESERRRIARDLHDATLSDLRRLMLMSDDLPAAGAREGVGKPQRGVAPAVFRGEIESISDEIRRICEDLSPSALENVGFAAALEWTLSECGARLLPAGSQFTYEFVCNEDLDERLQLTHAEQMQLYRIVQEAVSNICRHAAATRVSLAVGATERNDLLLTLEDNGRGFNPRNKKARAGRGLSNIKARASIINAEVAWKERAGGGTTFVLRKRAGNSVNGGDAAQNDGAHVSNSP